MRRFAMVCGAMLAACGAADGAFVTLTQTAAMAREVLPSTSGLPSRTEWVGFGTAGYGAGYTATGVMSFGAPAIPVGDLVVSLTVSGVMSDGSPLGASLRFTVLSSPGPVTQEDFDAGSALATFLVAAPRAPDTSPFSVILSGPMVLAASEAASGLRVRIDGAGTGGDAKGTVQQLSLAVTTAATTPEPASLVMLAIGGVAVLAWRRAA